MEPNQNTKAFLSKLAHKYKCTEDMALKILVEEVHGSPSATIEQGKITTLNTRRIPWAVTQIWEREYNESIPIKILSFNEIDIRDLSDLCDLSFRANEKIEPLVESFSFVNYPNLAKLEFSNHNIRSIELNANNNLIDLDCSMNELVELNVSNNIQLKRINCQINKISSLDLSKNVNLEYVNIRYSTIDQHRIKFPEQNSIEELYIDETQINEIDLSLFKRLRELQIGNSFSSLDITQCSNLISLSLIRTKLKSLDISNCPTLSELTLYEGKIDELITNEFQSFVIPNISKKLKLRASLEQKSIIKAFELHSKALSHNWDEGLSKLKKILKDDNCDRATALAIFWMGRPNHYLQFRKISDAPEHSKELFRFLNKLEKELLEGQYCKNLISFNPKNHLNNDWTIDSLNNNTAIREIDNALKEEVIGEKTTLFNYESKVSIKNYS